MLPKLRVMVALGIVGVLAAPAVPAADTSGGAAPAAGRFVWQDLVTRDAAACRRFYGDLLGWEFQEMTRRGRPYVVARSQGRLVGGIVEAKDPATERAAWLSGPGFGTVSVAVPIGR